MTPHERHQFRFHPDDLPRVDTLERRLTELEKQNNQLEAALDQRQHRALPDVTRRQTLGGFLLGGALVGAGDQVTVIGNVLYSSTGDGILADGPSQSVSVIGNSVNGPDNSGIHLVDTRHSAVIGNTIREAGAYGILSEGTSDYLAVSANVITNTGTEAVLLANSHNKTNGEDILQ
jgi:hypothetical protein